ncbi:MAG: histidine kinase [Gemmatimonadales bacterium]|jgi:signal transduction histidine kinase|nr:histidine kinase [Gemmatimonadales bacterium]
MKSISHGPAGTSEHARLIHLTSNAAHELRTPLAGLRVRLEEALLYPDDTDPQAAITDALRSVERLEAIVADLLLLEKLRTGQAPSAELVDLTALVTAETARECHAHISMHVVAESGVRVRGVAVLLPRLVCNLLDSAVRNARTTVEVTLCSHGGQAVLTVTADGNGIPAADRERVFECFSRPDTARNRSGGGTGLGLSLAKNIATIHGGSLVLQDGAGGGFVLQLPLERPEIEYVEDEALA